MRQIFFFVFMCVHTLIYAQKRNFISMGPDISLPSTNLKGTSVSIGGSFQYQIKFNAPVALQLHAGYSHFKDGFGGKVNFLPIRAGVVGYLYQDILYVYTDAGISHYQSPTTTTKQNGFSFGFGGGYRQKLGVSQFLQFSTYYNLHNFKLAATSQNYNYTWFNIRAAYGFSFGRKSKKDD